MKLKILALLLFCISSSSLLAQTGYEIKGIVTDTAASYKMVNATVSVLNAKDSTLVRFSRASDDGGFHVQHLKAGKFLLMITYPGYADYIEDFSLDSGKKTIDFNQINMILKSTLLSGVIIKGNITAVKIKGDTTEFNAAAYTIQPNSKVEDLLKQLPGIEVDRKGNITAYGKAVTKVLVDGEEFFGDDPTLVTKNLRGDMVDKVQLYDKKSDQAVFSGIDDGEKTKTLNIKLKEDKKNGYFGKLEGGLGTDDFYQNQAMFNAFKGKKKFSVYGTMGNTGVTGLGWQDNRRYGNSEQENDYYYSGDNGLDSYNGRYDGDGIPKTKSAGSHYYDKWNKDKESINANYKAGEIQVDGSRNSLSQNNLPDGGIYNKSDQNFSNYMFRQKLDGVYTLAIDTSSNLKVTADATLKNARTEDHFVSSSSREGGIALNDSKRDLNNESHQQLFNASVWYAKKLKKKGRTFSFGFNENYNKNTATGFLNSENRFYNAQGALDSTQLTDQHKTNNTVSNNFKASATYTEPLSKTLSLALNYALTLTNSTSDQRSFNKSGPDQYNDFDARFSNDFKLDQLSNGGSAALNYKKGKTVLNFGTRASNVRFEQSENYSNKSYKRNFTNWNPYLDYNYAFSQMRGLRFNYYGNTSQPQIEQLQPIRNNNDPLNIRLGNPDLKPSFGNSMSFSYNSYKVLSQQSIYLNGSFGFTNNPIIDNVITDETGKSTYRSINLKEKQPINYSFSIYAGRKTGIFDSNIGIDLTTNFNTNFSMVNNELNTTSSAWYSGQLTLSKYIDKKYNFRLSGGPYYTSSTASIQKQLGNSGWGANGNFDFGLRLPGKIELSTNADYFYAGKTQTFDKTLNRLIWNSTISKKFFKEEALKLSLSGNDLLNQNTRFQRSAYNNIVSQSNTTTIKRYFMMTLSWDFNKMGGSEPKK